ncbi:hypothetical protein VTJ04DRAFT_4563 [Mycothermus thermophilus]|uniref:uncharacterized protein n=1 Tax=Humicola insolens TaxID=85995 RepID=UPI00374301D9
MDTHQRAALRDTAQTSGYNLTSLPMRMDFGVQHRFSMFDHLCLSILFCCCEAPPQLCVFACCKSTSDDVGFCTKDLMSWRNSTDAQAPGYLYLGPCCRRVRVELWV